MVQPGAMFCTRALRKLGLIRLIGPSTISLAIGKKSVYREQYKIGLIPWSSFDSIISTALLILSGFQISSWSQKAKYATLSEAGFSKSEKKTVENSNIILLKNIDISLLRGIRFGYGDCSIC